MKYVMVIYEPASALAERESAGESAYVAAWRSYYRALVDVGAYVGGAPLQATATATTVRVRDGKPQVQDGPFAEAKEGLGGFMILEAPTLDAALDWAARCPAAAVGALEVRPMDVSIHESITEG